MNKNWITKKSIPHPTNPGSYWSEKKEWDDDDEEEVEKIQPNKRTEMENTVRQELSRWEWSLCDVKKGFCHIILDGEWQPS